MKYIFLIVLLILVVFGTCNYSSSKKNIAAESKKNNTDTLVYDVVNSVLLDEEKVKNINTEFVLDKENMRFPFAFKDDSLQLLSRDSLFSKIDIEYIFSQKKVFEAFTLKPDELQSKTLIPVDSVEKYKAYISIGRPLFNKSQKLAIVRFSYYCGMLCGYSNVYIYQNKEGRWTRIKVIQESVS